MSTVHDQSPEGLARRRAKQLIDLLWHIGAFVIVNAALWGLDLAQGGGIEWAYWTTGPWGIGLAFHIAAYLIDGSNLEDRLTQRFLDQAHRH